MKIKKWSKLDRDVPLVNGYSSNVILVIAKFRYLHQVESSVPVILLKCQ